MSDAICGRCQEPWELYYLAHEAMYEFPGEHAPEPIKAAHEALTKADDEWYQETGGESRSRPSHYDLGGKLLQMTVLKGEGCPACWDDPSRVVAGEHAEEAALDALRHNLFDSTWDGDPAELL